MKKKQVKVVAHRASALQHTSVPQHTNGPQRTAVPVKVSVKPKQPSPDLTQAEAVAAPTPDILPSPAPEELLANAADAITAPIEAAPAEDTQPEQPQTSEQAAAESTVQQSEREEEEEKKEKAQKTEVRSFAPVDADAKQFTTAPARETAADDGAEKNWSGYFDAPSPPPEPEVTYSLKKGEIIGGSLEGKPLTDTPKKPSSKKSRKKAKQQKRAAAQQQTTAAAPAAVAADKIHPDRQESEMAKKSKPTAPPPQSSPAPQAQPLTGGVADGMWAAAAPAKKAKKDSEPRVVQPFGQLSPVRKAVAILSLALAVFSFSPLMVGVLTPGILPPLCIGLFFFALARYWNLIRLGESKLTDLIYGTVAALVCIGIAGMSFISGQMVRAGANTPPDNRSDYTVVVLGCKINGDQPSRMLGDRLNRAAEYLLAHPGAHCVVSGGQGDDEPCPEARVMKRVLVEKGVSEWRIITEEHSFSTQENIENTAAMLDEYNLHPRLLIATDRFHQFRAQSYATECGLESYSLCNETRWYLAMQYWFREMAAIVKMWLAG
ncbi:MAG: hypothetical protein E7559_08540 [Ruminococcaceae bacterium]|nr:hypothetical protein [Oscillospiraceae bacterium]